mmetsp:Transcript_20850/g.49346  ORF Transcript_20850/g.49346 Transcript_20850/m.49346 type:complete len:210 (-) Transcript_20850:738-1367(-)
MNRSRLSDAASRRRRPRRGRRRRQRRAPRFDDREREESAAVAERDDDDDDREERRMLPSSSIERGTDHGRESGGGGHGCLLSANFTERNGRSRRSGKCVCVGRKAFSLSIDRSIGLSRPSVRPPSSGDRIRGRRCRSSRPSPARAGRSERDRSDHEQQKERSITRNDPPKEKTCKKTSTPHRQRLEMRFRGRRQTSSGLHREWYSDLML